MKITYKREKLIELTKEKSIPIQVLPKESQMLMANRIQQFKFLPYNSEGTEDHGWGCAWRCIQSMLLHLKENGKINQLTDQAFSFETLFMNFGEADILIKLFEKILKFQQIDETKFMKILVESQFSPFQSNDGWAEPFIAHLILINFEIFSELYGVNNYPLQNAPKEILSYQNKLLTFQDFRDKLLKHFSEKSTKQFPVMIDDGVYSLLIIGAQKNESSELEILMADPHIKKKCSSLDSSFYLIQLEFETGKQLKYNFLTNGDFNYLRIIENIRFQEKSWMVLFPSYQI